LANKVAIVLWTYYIKFDNMYYWNYSGEWGPWIYSRATCWPTLLWMSQHEGRSVYYEEKFEYCAGKTIFWCTQMKQYLQLAGWVW